MDHFNECPKMNERDMKDYYEDLISAGFTEKQAIPLLQAIILGNQIGDPIRVGLGITNNDSTPKFLEGIAMALGYEKAEKYE